MWVSERWYRQHARYTAPTWHGVWGALRGESPRTREGRRPDRTELQWSVISCQWSEATALALLGDANCFRLVVTRCVRKFTLVLDCALRGPIYVARIRLLSMGKSCCWLHVYTLDKSPTSKRYIWRPLPAWAESMMILLASGLERGWRSQRSVSVYGGGEWNWPRSTRRSVGTW